MPPQAAEATNPLISLLFFPAIIVIFYFFMIRPQMKRQKELRQYRKSVKKGDKVITTGGIYGRVIKVKDAYVTVEIAKEVEIKIDKSAIIMDMTDAVRKYAYCLSLFNI